MTKHYLFLTFLALKHLRYYIMTWKLATSNVFFHLTASEQVHV